MSTEPDPAHEADLELNEEQTTEVTGGRHRTLNYEHSDRPTMQEDRAARQPNTSPSV